VSDLDTQDSLEGIAVVGMAGRFPGANNLDEFWRNLRDGIESITCFTKEELEAAGVDPAHLDAPEYVRAGGALENVEMFDAAFFGFSPREAEIMDPQYRFFMTTVWEALESAGYNTATYPGSIGIFGGMNFSKYLIFNLLTNEELMASEGPLQVRILNDKDFLASLAAYKLNLKGPTATVQTACSTSLVAVNMACLNLLNYQCDVALAGGVSVSAPAKSGYFPQEGVFSSDGHCRAFDEHAGGTLGGDGVGIVVLKRLADAVADGDNIRAVIKGSAINNDGAHKVGYTAPSVDGQAEVIAMAQAFAGVEAETITYVEAHGTATPMGDPIEISALTQVFRNSTDKKGFCAIGSVKTNIGHLDAAAGVASLIKTILAMEHKMLPPSLHYTQPNPQIDFANSPFYVNSKLAEWKVEGMPRRAGVSAFAVGGVNAHVIVEETPALEPSGASRPAQLLILSAKSGTALEKATDNLAAALKQQPELNLADVAYTLQVGRAEFNYRRTLVCHDADDAVKALESRDPKRVQTNFREPGERALTFMFPGLGNHYVNMGLELYQTEPAFRFEIDRCCELLKPHLGLDLREMIYPAAKETTTENQNGDKTATGASSGFDLRAMLKPRAEQEQDEATRKLNQTYLTQPALFVIEYALAKVWMKWGIIPQAMIGYSIGEYVAACLSGVFSLEDALSLVARRAQMIEELPGGAMLAVPLSEKELQPLLSENVALASINGPSLCVLAGPTDEISGIERELKKRGLACRQLSTSHAFHSNMMTAIIEPFTRLVKSVELKAPQIPFISNVTGTWITATQATDPNYWARHMCQTVQYSDGLSELFKTPRRILLEVGPGQVMGAWALQHPSNDANADVQVLASLRHSYDPQSDMTFLLNSLGRLWAAGADINWPEFYSDEKRRRVPLPTYPFEPQRYWIAPRKHARENAPLLQKSLDKSSDIGEWFYTPVWKQSPTPMHTAENASADAANQKFRWLLFMDEMGVGSGLAERLSEAGHEVFTVRMGERFERSDASDFAINARAYEDYGALFAELRAAEQLPERIVHLWSVVDDEAKDEIEFAAQCQEAGFNSLLLLAQAIGNHSATDALHVDIVSNNMQEVVGEEKLHVGKATLLGPCRVIPQEFPNVTCRSIDILLSPDTNAATPRVINQLIAELYSEPSNAVVALRGRHRWQQAFESLPLNSVGESRTRLRPSGVYLITGGVGGIGLSLAEYLAQTVKAKLILTGRSPLPAREKWNEWLAAHDEADDVSRKIRRVRSLEEMGAEVLMLSADVSDREAMRSVIEEARERFGEINGVVHAAGVSPGGLIQVKTPQMAASVLEPKVRGTLILNELLEDVPLDFFILCSSLASIMGGLGMVDHCGANAFLDAFAHRRSTLRNDAFTLSLNWDAWLEVGQAAKASVSAGLKDLLQTSNSEEIDHPLLDRSLVDDANRKIYSTQLSTTKQWVVDEHRIMGNGLFPGTAYLEMVRAAFERQAPNQLIAIEKVLFMSPLIVKDGEEREVRTIIEKGEDESATAATSERFSFLVLSREHSTDNNQTEWQEHVRGEVVGLVSEPPRQHQVEAIMERCCNREIVFDAGQQENGRNGHPHLFHIEDFKNSTGLIAKLREASDPLTRFIRDNFSAESHQLLLQKQEMPAAAGLSMQKLLADEFNRLIEHPSLYDEQRFAEVELSAHAQSLIAQKPRGEDLLRLNRLLVEEALLRERADSARKQGLYFGPRWQNLLKKLNVGENEGLAYLELSEEFSDDIESFGMHPSLMDAATGFVQLVGEGVYLPLAYESVRIHAPLTRKIYSHVLYKDRPASNKETITCNILIMDEDGNELIEIKDYTLKKMNDAAVFKSLSGEKRNGDGAKMHAPHHTSEQQPERVVVEQDLPQSANDGIFPKEGAEAFSRVLSKDLNLPQLAVSTKNLPALIERANSFSSSRLLEEIEKLQSHRAKHPRPNIQTPYVEPRNELERSLANIWQDILGLEQVGIYDNFFDIGGDSLLATQLIARLSKNFSVDLPLRAVFESPTVGELGLTIIQQQAGEIESDEMTQILAELEALPEE
jgi:acyl transferase domain-containing protein/acyl carrier protein